MEMPAYLAVLSGFRELIVFKSFLVFSILLVSSQSFCRQTAFLDSVLTLIGRADEEERHRLEALLVAHMYVDHYDSAYQLNQTVIRIGPSLKHKTLYIRGLIHSWRFFDFQKKISNLRTSVTITAQEGELRLLGDAYMFLGIAYRDNAQPDSAMIYALMARDLYEEYGDSHDIRAILQLIADMHFYAGEYEQARILYEQTLSSDYPDPWFGWRHRIITANLGLISIKQNRLDDAMHLFQTCLDTLNSSPNLNIGDSSAYSYIYRKLMEVSLLKRDYAAAEKYYRLGEQIGIRLNVRAELPGLYIGKSSILLQEGKNDSALAVLKLAERLEKQYPDLKYKIDMYRSFADIYKARGDFLNAGVSLEKLLAAKTAADSIFNRARIMHLYAHHNYLNSLQKGEQYKNERNLFYIIAGLSTSSLAVFIFLFLRIKKSYRILIEKNLDLAYSNTNEPIPLLHGYPPEENVEDDALQNMEEREETEPILNEDTAPGGLEGPETVEKQKKLPDPDKIKEILQKVELAVLHDKIYLDSNLSIAKCAGLLGTNRTYLALAVNSGYNMGFSEYINGHRVKEAIKLMSSPEAKEFTLDGIAEKSGFNNRVTFSKVFREHTGINPSYFMKNLTSSDMQYNIARAD